MQLKYALLLFALTTLGIVYFQYYQDSSYFELYSANLDEEIFAEGQDYSLTVVSGYWKIKGKHKFSKYSNWFRNSTKIRAPYLIFYEDSSVKSALKGFRNGLHVPTKFIYKPMARFNISTKYNRFWTHKVHVPSVEVGMIWNEKVYLIDSAIRYNPFHSDWFAWIDLGCAEYRWQAPPEIEWPLPTNLAILPKDRVIYTSTPAHVPRHHKFAGTAFMYHKDLQSRVLSLYEKSLRRCTREFNDWRCGSDQIVFSLAMEQEPDLFHCVGEGYGALVTVLYSRLPS